MNDLVKRLRGMDGDSMSIETLDEAADRIEALELALTQSQDIIDRWINTSSEQYQTIVETQEALTQSRAETAAAYELAADIAASWVRKAMHLNPNGYDIERLHGKEITSATISAIRALATPDQTSALDAVRAEARAQGMREAAEIALAHCYAIMSATDADARAALISAAILAAIKGAKA